MSDPISSDTYTPTGYIEAVRRRQGPGKPAVGAATNHLEGLRKHLLAIGHPAEASAVTTALNLLMSAQTRPRRLRAVR